MKHRQKKGQLWIQFVIYMLIAVAILTIIIKTGVPVVNKIRDRVAVTKAEDTLSSVDQTITDITKESLGSQRVIPLTIPEGTVTIGDDILEWRIESEAEIIESRTNINRGNLDIVSDASVGARETGTDFILNNSIIEANISKLGNLSTWVPINLSELLNYVKYIDTSERIENVTFAIGNFSDSSIGNGYTILLNSGNNLGSSTVIAHINNSELEYDLALTLETGADFLKIQARNTVIK